MILNREQLAWAAGFFEGEGSTSLNRNKHLDGRGYIGLSVSQKDREVLDRFHAAIGGLGNVTESPARPASPFTWCTSRFEHCQAVLAMLWPFMGQVKRAQAQRALTGYWSVTRQSPADRVRIMRAMGRRTDGSPRPHGKLTVDDVTTILDLLAHGATQRTVAECFGVQPPHISKIKSGHSYAHYTVHP